MDLVREITKNIKIVLKNKIEEQAVENMLYAKMAHLFALKDIKFTSTNNLKKPATLAYYAVNFIGSGGAKNQSVSTFEECVIPFLDDEYKRLDLEVARLMLAEEIELLDETSKNYSNEKHKLEKKYANGGVINFKTNGGTPAALYSKLEKIDKYKKGALFAQMTEFADYYRVSVENNQSVNKSFLDCLNNLYEGLFEPSDSMGTARREIKGVAFSLLFMSDIEEMMDAKNNANFKRRLKSGYARRINFYFDREINYSKNPPPRVTIQQKKEAYENLQFCSTVIKGIYDKLPRGTEFVFTEEANEALDAWDEECQREVCKFYEYDNKLTLENNIKKVEIENSTWKITKMAVLIQILKGEDLPRVTADSVSKAIEFYKKCRKSLYNILEERQITKESELASYFLNRIGETVKKNDIKAQRFVNDNYFSKWFTESLGTVQDILADKGFELVPAKKKGNTQAFICQRIIKPEEVLINVSYSNDTYGEHPSRNFEYVECNTDAFTDLILNSKALSAQKFKDNYRNDVNACGIQNTLWLDFDDGLTIEEAKKIFKDYWYVMYTTPHHQKPKDKKPACDRFRVVFKVKEPMPTDITHYKKVMAKIIEKYGADIQCQNISRYYKGNPEAEILIQEEGDYFDWKEFDVSDKPQESEKQHIEIKKYEGEDCEGLTDETIFTDLGTKILKGDEIVQGNRDGALAYSIGVLIKAVNDHNLSHSVAQRWLEDKLSQVMTSDFKQNADKYRKRLQNLKF